MEPSPERTKDSSGGTKQADEIQWSGVRSNHSNLLSVQSKLSNTKPNEKVVFESQICTLVLNMWHKKIGYLTMNKFLQKYDVTKIEKAKIYKQPQPYHSKSYMVKITIQQKDYTFAAKYDTFGQWFHHLVWVRLSSMQIYCPIDEQFINVCSGEIWRKTPMFGGWQQRHVMITPKDGLMLYKDRKQGPTTIIEQTKQIWTRFELIQGASHLVVKLKSGFFKQQFGIPVLHAMKWLRAFYSMFRIN